MVIVPDHTRVEIPTKRRFTMANFIVQIRVTGTGDNIKNFSPKQFAVTRDDKSGKFCAEQAFHVNQVRVEGVRHWKVVDPALVLRECKV